MNLVALKGRLTREVEERKTPSGMTVSKFSIAINKRKKTASGGYEDEAMFFDCVAFGKTAESLGRFFVKGDRILIQGELSQSRWDDKDSGAKRSRVEVLVNQWYFAGNKIDRTGGGQVSSAQNNVQNNLLDDVDIPF